MYREFGAGAVAIQENLCANIQLIKQCTTYLKQKGKK